MSSRVKGFDSIPYCLARSLKKVNATFKQSDSSASSINNHPIESVVKDLLPVNETGISSPAAINSIPEKFHPLETPLEPILPNPRHPTFLYPFWTLVPPLVPNNLNNFLCSRGGTLQVSSLSTLFRSEVLKLLNILFDMATLSSNSDLDSRVVNNDPLSSDFVRDQLLTTAPFPLSYTELSSIMQQMQPPTRQRCLSPLSGYDETFASITNRDSLVANLGILQASSYPPPHYYSGSGGMDPPDRPRGSGKGKGREGSWQDEERESREGSAGGSAGGNNEESGPSKRKTSKKTPMACHFCRKRKLKCDGVQPTCHTCAEKSLVCSYDEQIRRRGPGKKNRLAQQQQRQSSSSEAQQQPEASSSSSSLPSSLIRTIPGSTNSPLITLPRPPMPQYPYQLGTPPTGLESRIVSSRLASEGRSSEPERYVEDYPSQRGVYTQQPRRQHPEFYQQQQQQPSTSYPGYQQSSYRDQPPPPPPLPPQTYPYPQRYRQDYSSTSSIAEHSVRRRSYVEEEEIEYVSDDDNTTSSRPGPPSPEYEEDLLRRRGGGDSWQR
ncbi:hypothetical protein Clacol_009810 [Clathrus columnatus]|uniref:Zn(2)-C6 fungal-type domain-containing protein n=1 Tax=Clathrus columnatus TaxID=1419009 RepID=A0AAV5AP04_9AGAM|nr:hypothetical protein Clacol_009810 [Clathrus columnatus]